MDLFAYQVLTELSLPNLTPIFLADFERFDPKTLETKQTRTVPEYYFTCTPSWPLYIFHHNADVDLITHLDADLFFFSDPAPIYDEMKGGSVLIVEHRFPPRLEHMQLYGIYNVGLVSFRRDERGLECLEWWRDRCQEWCYDRVEGERFADQKYLNDWPSRFPGVVVLQHKGAGLAPWNLDNYSLSRHEGVVFVDSAPLIFFHFHGFTRINPWVYDPGSTAYALRGSSLVKRHLYEPYWQTLRSVEHWISHNSNFSRTFPPNCSTVETKRYNTPEAADTDNCRTKLKHYLTLLKNLVLGRYWLFLHGRIL